MKNNNCSKRRIIDAYYSEAKDKEVLEHIEKCSECARFYDDLKNMGEKMDLINNTGQSPNPFSVNRIISTHLAQREKRRIIREAFAFFLTSSVVLGILCGTVIVYDLKFAAASYLLIFLLMPFLLIPAVIKRKEII